MLTFCQMTMNRELETMHCLQKYLPHVDRAVIVDGGSTDNTIISLRNWSQDEPKINFFLYPWKDNFSDQRSNYLKHVPDNTWCLVSDPDEWFDQDLLENLPNLIATAEANKKDMVGFQCRSVSMKGPKRVHENLDNYWKRLLFKKYPGTVYGGNPHEHLVNHPHQIMDTKFVYEHVKQQNVTWPRGMRNMFVGGGGPNGRHAHLDEWKRLRSICSSLGINTFAEFDKALLAGNVDQRLKQWMVDHMKDEGWDGASEFRETYKTYYRIYHPSEEPEEFRGVHIP